MPAASPEVEMHHEAAVLRPRGDVDVESAGSLREAAIMHVDHDHSGLVIDLSVTGWIDSAGLRVLFSIANRLEDHRQRLALVVPAGAAVRRTLDVVGMASRAELHATLDEALASLGGTALA